jgi:hypothetical protein
MQINIADEVFGFIPAFKILNAIHTAINQHHELMIDFNGSAYLNWVAECEAHLDPEISVLLAYALGSSIFVGSKRFVQVVNSPSKKNQITFDELEKVMLRSFFIYVENGRADKRFVYSLLSPELRRDLRHQENISAVTFENAGGISELAKKLVDDHKSRSKLPLRAFALFDSDALEPGVASKDALEAQKVCRDLEIPFYCLSKRAIENYIPDDALLSFAAASSTEVLRMQRKRLARAVGRLSDVQKSHFHMKEGFKAPHGPLYAHVRQGDAETLLSGFGSHLSECYNEGGIIDKKCLEQSDGWAELEGLVTILMEAF